MKEGKEMLLIGKGTVFTRDPACPMIENGGVLTDGNEILKVGDFEQLQKDYPDAEHVDAHGKWIMPAFINAHHHIYSAFSRGCSINGYDPRSFLDILEGWWWTIDGNLNVEDSRLSAVAVYMSCIENGVTTIFDHHASYGETLGSLHAIAGEAKRFGVRSCLCYEITDRNGREEMEKAVAENVSFIKESKSDPDMLAGMMGMHASFTLSDETLKYSVDRNPGAGYHIHVAEGIYDEEECLKNHGCRVVERLERFGILGETSIAGHCVHVDDSEIDRLVKSNTMIVHNPESNMGNAIGAPDVLKLMGRGLTVGLGNDGFMSDMLESYKFANALVKHANQKGYVGWAEIPEMFFVNNAKMAAKYFPKKLGVLQPGAYADVIVMDYAPITPYSADNLNGHLLFGANGTMVVTTVSNGEVRMKDRVLIGINKDAEAAACRAQAGDLWKRINSRK